MGSLGTAGPTIPGACKSGHVAECVAELQRALPCAGGGAAAATARAYTADAEALCKDSCEGRQRADPGGGTWL